MRSKLVSFCVLLLISFCAACAPRLGATIEAPQIPPASTKSDARAKLGSYVSIQSVEDTRVGPAVNADETPDFTEPYGGVNAIVENGIKKAFQEAGIAVVDSAPVTMKAEVRKWRSQVDAKTTGALSSEATLYVELQDPSGKKLYSGTYNGTRASQFPVVTRVDVQDSLGLAMANAIAQIMTDTQFLELLGSY